MSAGLSPRTPVTRNRRRAVKEWPLTPFARWVQFATSVILLPAIFAGAAWIISVETRLVRIESNRFTSGDGLKIYELLSQKADKANVPPPEVRQSLYNLAEAIKENREEMRKLRDTMNTVAKDVAVLKDGRK